MRISVQIAASGFGGARELAVVASRDSVGSGRCVLVLIPATIRCQEGQLCPRLLPSLLKGFVSGTIVHSVPCSRPRSVG